MTTPIRVSSLLAEKSPTVTRDDCSYYGRVNTTGFGFIRSYEGIPENILVNLVVSSILLLLFAYLRRRFSDSKSMADGTEISTLLYGQSNSSRHTAHNSRWLWIRDLFTISDWDVYRNCSPDAYYYLLFHTYLITYLLFVTIFSLAIVLPVNFQGTQGTIEQRFAQSTIANLPPDSPLLWVHACASILFVLAGIVVAYLYTNATRYYATEDMASRTLMIRGIPHEACNEEKLNEYFKEAYPAYNITHLTLAYNIAQLQHCYKRRELNLRIWQQSKKMFEESGKRPVVYNNKCGQMCGCCAKEVDAIEYYEKLYNTYKERVEHEYLHVRSKKCGLAFVTFSTPVEAHRVRSNFQPTCFAADRRPKPSISNSIGIHEWNVSFAPSPKNIIWKNIPMSEVSHWFRIIVVNIVLVFFMIFLTTPSIVMSTIDKIANKYRSIDPLKRVTKQIQVPVFLTSVMPVLLLRIFAAAMPSLVSVTSLLEKQWKKSALDKSMMIKLFVFLSMMILILPSLGLTSIEGFLRWVFENEENVSRNNRIRWMCVFLPDNGAFFVNYIITSAFIGAAIELLRLADLVFYIYIIVTAKSTAERRVIRHALQFPFRFGVQYAWTSAVFCVIIAYAITCPLITPIGLVYLFIKRAVDKYNLVFVYDTEIADKSVHRLAGNFIIIALIIQQLTLLFFVLVRSETLTYLSMTLLGSFILTSGVYLGFSCFDCCGRWSSRKYSLSTPVSETAGNRQKLDDLGELEEMEGHENKQRATSHYIPTILNACIEEFDIPPSATKIRRSSIREPLPQGTYGTTDPASQPMVVGTGDENDLLID
ncbi:unnamed protein product [Adineta steineri]|uniref:CSC1-like protein 2 n=1 Tax=Adineta steineri TaxID=433720 RepID=A0A818V8W1_9BILA|nr:unnamed protein product [Adineta steineri]CAF3707718.1 unnamed protein product [Adineta steineri]